MSRASTSRGTTETYRRPEFVRLLKLERRAKEGATLSPTEQARLEVETHDTLIEVLLSVHKEHIVPTDWHAIASCLVPVPPQGQRHHELGAKRCLISAAAGFPAFTNIGPDSLAQARLKDERDFRDASAAHSQQIAALDRRRSLARRVLAGDQSAFGEALAEFAPLAELSDLALAVEFIVHHTTLIACALKIKGTEIIPRETKTLTATGKLSVKPMAKRRFHEIFQDYVCGCVLRVAREMFCFLPVDAVLVTASVDVADGERPVLSAVISRRDLDALDWGRIDPSDAVEGLLHRGNVKMSKTTGEFVAIAPLLIDDVPRQERVVTTLAGAVAAVGQLRDELHTLSETWQAVERSDSRRS